MYEILNIDVDLSTLERAVSPQRYDQGAGYARQRAVRAITWTPADALLRGTVRVDGQDCQATVSFEVPDGRSARFAGSQCGCGAEGGCSHVVALVHAASPSGARRPAAEPRPRAAWGQSLDRLPAGATGLAVPLGIGVEVTGDPGRERLMTARIVQPSPRGGWMLASVSWRKLDSEGCRRDYSERQVTVLQGLYGLYQESGGGDVDGHDRHIDLSAIESPRLWELLDDAATAGLPLVDVSTGRVLPAYEEGRFHLDVIRYPSGGLRITPVILTGDGEPVVPLAFIGAEGAVCTGRAQPDGELASRFRPVRLTRPVPQRLRRMALAGDSRKVRADAVPAFYRGLYAWLLRNANLVSSDGSFDLPAISGPELVLRLFPGPGDELGLTWKFAYQIDAWRLYAELSRDMPDEEFRRPADEDALLGRLDLPVRRYRLGFPGQSDESVPRLLPHTRLTGQHMTRFVTELLPRLAREPRVRIEVSNDPAGQRETASSLRIAAATDEAAGHKDWFDLDVPITVAGRPVPFRDVFLALNCGDRRLQLADGTYVPLDGPELQELARMIAVARALHDPAPAPSSRFQDELLNELAALGVPEEEALAWREKVLRLTSYGPAGRAEPPAELKDKLRPHQQRGFDWLAYLWENQLGGILADEMGLGKTLQCLALISHARQRDPAAAPFLIVVPTCVLANWADEAARFTPDLSVMPVTKTVASHRWSLDGLFAGADAVITTYNLLRLDFDVYQQRAWSGLLLDEAQAVKNLQSDIYDRVRRLPVPVKIAITGTPLENNIMELWSLLSITAPGLFPRPDLFFSQYARPIQDEGDNERVARLQRLIGPLVMRRTKDQGAAELPPKQEHVLEVDLHSPHRDVYQTWLQRERQKILGLDDEILVNRFTILRSLTRLRQLSLHAGLIDDAYADLPSAKIDTLIAKLAEVTGGEHRALVFSQFTGFLGKVRARLEAEGMPYCYLDGRTRDRAGVVRKFKAGAAPVFLISLKAGGTGLNLTEADHAFLLDPWWNPATEAQAIDRVHRIGQTRGVSVYRLVARNTVEEKVRLLQARKAQLFASVMGGGGMAGGAFDADDIRDLLADIAA